MKLLPILYSKLLLCVEEVVTHFMSSNLLYKMGHYFLDILYKKFGNYFLDT